MYFINNKQWSKIWIWITHDPLHSSLIWPHKAFYRAPWINLNAPWEIKQMNWIGSKSAIYEIGKLSKATKNKRRVSEVNQFALVSQNETETLQNALWPILIHEISLEYFFGKFLVNPNSARFDYFLHQYLISNLIFKVEKI